MILDVDFSEKSVEMKANFEEGAELQADFGEIAELNYAIIKTLSFEKLYAISASAVAAPTQWETAAPTPTKSSPYLWMRTITRGTGEDGTIYEHDDRGVVIGVSVVGKDGYTPVKGKDYFDGEPGDDGFSPTVAVSKSGKVTTVSITDKDGKKTATINDGTDGTAGQRGTSLLLVTTTPSSYTTAVNGLTPAYRIALSTVKTQASTEEVFVGDTIQRSYYIYPVIYVDSSYVYCGARVSVRGSAGTSVTVSSVSETTADGGSNVVTFSDGNTLSVKNGKNGTNGRTPEKGVDYMDAVDKAAIVAEVIDSIIAEAPETHIIYGDVDSANNITIFGELADGTYILKYENADGTVTEIGSLVLGFKNLAEPNSTDWLTDKRINSSHAVTNADPNLGNTVTNFVSCRAGDVVRVKGLNIARFKYTDGITGRSIVRFYEDKASTPVLTAIPADDATNYKTVNGVWTFTVGNGLSGDTSKIKYVRFNGALMDGYAKEDVIITVNQAIN